MRVHLIQVNGRILDPSQPMPVRLGKKKTSMSPIDYPTTFLASRREDLSLRLASIERSLERFAAPISADSEDRAVEISIDEVLDRLADATRRELAQVDHAVDRIASGHYGICEIGHCLIPASRLRVVPEATTCSACALTQKQPERPPVESRVGA